MPNYKWNTAAQIMRDAIVTDHIPELRKLGRTEFCDRMEEAVAVGEQSGFIETSAYWEGLLLFCKNEYVVVNNLKKLDGIQKAMNYVLAANGCDKFEA